MLPSQKALVQLRVFGLDRINAGGSPQETIMFDPDVALLVLVLFIVVAALLFPGGPGTPRRIPVKM